MLHGMFSDSAGAAAARELPCLCTATAAAARGILWACLWVIYIKLADVDLNLEWDGAQEMLVAEFQSWFDAARKRGAGVGSKYSREDIEWSTSRSALSSPTSTSTWAWRRPRRRGAR